RRRRRQAPPCHRESPPELFLGWNSLLLAGTSLPPVVVDIMVKDEMGRVERKRLRMVEGKER
ncbi:hypothetical protein A2U01_0114750, partial [Trifolium medium]|nr:hypothetical protein [Trifolium medium]